MINTTNVLVLWLTTLGSRAETGTSQHNLRDTATSNVVISPVQLTLNLTPPHACQMIMLHLFFTKYRHFLSFLEYIAIRVFFQETENKINNSLMLEKR